MADGQIAGDSVLCSIDYVEWHYDRILPDKKAHDKKRGESTRLTMSQSAAPVP